MRNWIALMVLLVALCVLVGQAGAYVYTFQNASDTSDFDAAGGAVPYGYPDLISFDSGMGLVKHKISYPTNYWAYSAYGTAGHHFRLYNSGGIQIYNTAVQPTATKPYRIEVVRDATVVRLYVNGILNGTPTTVGTNPYYFGWYIASVVDDVVVGTSEEKNVVSTIPQSWFVAKDIFDPGFSGVYCAPEVISNASYMHCSYANDDGSSTINIANVQTGQIYYSQTFGTYSGVATINMTQVLFNSGAPYGQYRVYMSDISGTAEDYFWYKAIATSGTQVQWDAAIYTEGDTATMTFSIAETNWDTDLYTYSLRILDGTTLDALHTYGIGSRPVYATREIEVNVPNFGESGTYYAALYAVSISSGTEYLLTYDDCDVNLPGSGEVWLEGVTYNATDGLLLGEVTVSATQLGAVQGTDLSDAATGAYSITSGLVTDWELEVNGSKTGYIGIPVAFTPGASGIYTVDVPLIPAGGPANGTYSNGTTAYYNSTSDGTALGGMCFLSPYWDLGVGTNCTISNSTWSSSVTCNAGGWYQCNNIPAGGSYTLTCNKDGYDEYSTGCSITSGCFNRLDCFMDTGYLITVEARDLSTLAILSGLDVTISLSTGESTTTTTGIANFTVAYGTVDATGSCIGYYPGTTSFIADAPKTVAVYLQESGAPDIDQGIGTKEIKFRCVSIWGTPLSDVYVTATGEATTTGSWDWLANLLGFDTNSTPIDQSEMGGYTDENGQLTFLMLPTVKYNMTFSKSGYTFINQSIQPLDEQYTIWAIQTGESPWYSSGYDIATNIQASVNYTEVNSTSGTIGFTWIDLLNDTDSMTLYLNQTNATAPNSTEVNLQTYTCTSCGNVSHTFTVTNPSGENYLVRANVTHGIFGNIQKTFAVSVPGIVEAAGIPSILLLYFSLFVMFFTGMIAGATAATPMTLIVCFEGWCFYFMRWLRDLGSDPIVIAALTFGTFLSLFAIIMVRSKKERFA